MKPPPPAPARPVRLATCRFLLPALLLCCSGPEPRPEKHAERVDPAVEASLSRYREPFQRDQTVIADFLEVEMSSNFYSEFGQPSVDRSYHEASRVSAPESVKHRWINRGGGAQVPLKLMIGRQRYIVLKEASLTVQTATGAVVLRAKATGDVKIVEGSQSRSVEELRIEDGVVRAR